MKQIFLNHLKDQFSELRSHVDALDGLIDWSGNDASMSDISSASKGEPLRVYRRLQR